MRGADALVRSLVNAGVRHVFTLSGNHIMSVFDAALDVGLDLVHTRHEAAAVHMADAWARITGEPGIALVTAAPGHANALSALYTAQMAESAVVLLSGHAAHDEHERGSFQEMRQAVPERPDEGDEMCPRPDVEALKERQERVLHLQAVFARSPEVIREKGQSLGSNIVQ